MAPKVFVTGVTGYIGGDFLYAISHKHPDWDITILVRTQQKADNVIKQFPNVQIAIGDNESKEVIGEEVAKADIVFHFANSADDEPSAKAISAALTKTGGIWIHTSGTYIIARPNQSSDTYGYDDGEFYDDWDGVTELTSLPDDAAHRDIDKIVLATGSDKIKTAIVCPPTIYGLGRGPDNRHSQQAYQSAENILRNKKGFIYGEGKNVWHHVHVHDLSDLYVALGEAAVNGGGAATWNEKGYYLAENGTFEWGQILRGIAQYAHEQGYIPSSEVEKIDGSKAEGRLPITVGTTSKGTAYRARKLLQWNPSKQGLAEEIPTIVDWEASKLGYKKSAQ